MKAKTFDRKFDAGKKIVEHLDISKARRVGRSRTPRLQNLEIGEQGVARQRRQIYPTYRMNRAAHDRVYFDFDFAAPTAGLRTSIASWPVVAPIPYVICRCQ